MVKTIVIPKGKHAIDEIEEMKEEIRNKSWIFIHNSVLIETEKQREIICYGIDNDRTIISYYDKKIIMIRSSLNWFKLSQLCSENSNYFPTEEIPSKLVMITQQ